MLLEDLLRDKNWYSRTLTTIYLEYKSKYGSPFFDEFIDDLQELTIKLEMEDDRINFFAHEGTLYMGLESRRLDYERDFKSIEYTILS